MTSARWRPRRGVGRNARATAMTALAEEKREIEEFEAGDDDLCDPERVRRTALLRGGPHCRGDGPMGIEVRMVCTKFALPRPKRGATHAYAQSE
jgi:hypothetical protein